MGQRDNPNDGHFLDRQRQRLQALRDELLQSERDSLSEERTLEAERTDRPRDDGEDAVNDALREVDRTQHDRAGIRLTTIERALEKIREGTYGLSDASDRPISRDRLEAVPEAIYTVEEETRIEEGWVPPPRARL